MPIDPPKSQPETARTEQNIVYILRMLGQLREVAETEDADMLCYLIEMAYLEAGDVLEGNRPLRKRGRASGR